jgi:diguanylate cyclase (GGDEF)-like protein
MSEWKTRVTSIIPVKQASGAASTACLVLIYPNGADMGRRFELTQLEHIIGRGADCDIQVDKDSVSRKHARVHRSGNGWSVSDLGSTNGSYLNDVPIKTESLRDGDLLKIGNTIFKFLTGGNIEVAYHEEIYRMTIIDGLTGFHNKRSFLEFLEREMARCGRYGRPLSLLMFDIDHFKRINDEHGHLTGDYVLKEMARRLQPRVRREELLARYGGEEFCAVLPETPRDGALQFAEQVRQIVANEAFEFEGDVMNVTVSVGVATLQGEPWDPQTFIKIVDDNLYRAKNSGRNRVVG